MNIFRSIHYRLTSICALIGIGLMLVIAANARFSGSAWAADIPKVQGKAPTGFELQSHTRGGAYFVARELKESYQRLRDRVALLKSRVDSGEISGVEAMRELSSLRDSLDKLREQIERERILIEPVKVHTHSETMSFELGAEQLLVITADDVRVEAWPGPGVKCVLQKTVLSADNEPADDEFGAIQLVHRQGAAPQLVGDSPAERSAKEQTFRESPEGRALTAEQLADRKRIVGEIADGFRHFAPFQGREIDTLEIAGLTHDQGNRQLLVEITSPDGGGALSSQWRRHAALTVFVPSCQAIALRGCLVKVEVDGLAAALLLTTQGSRDRDYNGTFRVRNLHGDLTVENAPLEVIENVRGNVTLVDTVGFLNTGTSHKGDVVTWYTPPVAACQIRDIEGDLTVWFARSNLSIEGVRGRIDIRNEFGNTSFRAGTELAHGPHRIISQSGNVDVILPVALTDKLPLLAVTQCGTVRAKGFRPHESSNVGLELQVDATLGRRKWQGFNTLVAKSSNADERFDRFQRVKLAIHGDERSPGLDVISFAGTVGVEIED